MGVRAAETSGGMSSLRSKDSFGGLNSRPPDTWTGRFFIYLFKLRTSSKYRWVGLDKAKVLGKKCLSTSAVFQIWYPVILYPLDLDPGRMFPGTRILDIILMKLAYC
jgi:hypothetical protein